MTRYATPVLIAFAVLQLLQGIWMVADPRSFYDQVAAFGPYNAHGLRDMATMNLALGAVLLASVAMPALRVGALAVAAVQFGLHTVNHAVDIGLARTTAMGVFDLVSLAAITAVLAWLVVVEYRRTPGGDGTRRVRSAGVPGGIRGAAR